MIAYHVVTDRPMHVGQQILFDENHHSGVYRRVYDKIDIVNDIYANPHKYDAETLEHHTSVALRELALEEVRQQKYPQYPSRMACLYVSQTLEEAERWGEFFARIGRPTYHIVKLDVQGNCFRGEATKCFDGQLSKEENLKLAEDYWESEGDPANPQSICEMLVDGRITVVEMVKEINANVNDFRYLTLMEEPALKDAAASWFHSKFGVPKEAYLECMDAYLNGETKNGWYLCLDGEKIVAGMGVIENDFHDRKDLAPNVCAVYTEEDYRRKGIAGNLLNFVVDDMKSKGISPIYLVTNHIGFYERYGWEFFCMAQGDDEPEMTRLYIHR